MGRLTTIPNYVSYATLVVISIVLLVCSWRKAANGALVPFYLGMVGLIYLLEYIILVQFRSYEYFPGVFRIRYLDNILGSIVSNGYIVPAAAALVAVYDLGFWWIALITASLVGVEELFLHMGLFRHYWWKTLYTAIGLPLDFLISKWLWHAIRTRSSRPDLQLAVLYFANISLLGTFIFYLVALFHLLLFRVAWFHDPYRGHFAFFTLRLFITSLFYSWAVVARANWLWKIVLLAALIAADAVLYVVGILEVSSRWVLGLLALFHIGELFLLIYMRRLLLHGQRSV
jgi:hypothetical protein